MIDNCALKTTKKILIPTNETTYCLSKRLSIITNDITVVYSLISTVFQEKNGYFKKIKVKKHLSNLAVVRADSAESV